MPEFKKGLKYTKEELDKPSSGVKFAFELDGTKVYVGYDGIKKYYVFNKKEDGSLIFDFDMK